MRTLLVYAVIAAAGTALLVLCLHVGWRAVGAYRISRAGPRPLGSGRHVLWRDPGRVELLDLSNGPGGPNGAPAAPSRFSKNIVSDLNRVYRSLMQPGAGGA
jgi:hypothetical protein